MKIPRILLAAGASGSGKTLITCGLLQALVNRKMKVASFKCGPDYIDPMFHSRVIGTKSRNLDTFFTDADVTRYLLGQNAQDCEIAVMEGVMGFYDGVGGISTKASAYDLADTTDTPDRKQQRHEHFPGCLYQGLYGIQREQPYQRCDL